MKTYINILKLGLKIDATPETMVCDRWPSIDVCAMWYWGTELKEQEMFQEEKEPCSILFMSKIYWGL